MYPLLAPRWPTVWLALAVLLASGGCASSSAVFAQRTDVAVTTPRESDAASLARLLPSGADRCSVAQPGVLAREHRALVALVSQSERLPWSLTLDVLAYARAERSPELGRRAVTELLRLAPAPRAQVMTELARVAGRPIDWSDAVGASSSSCRGELTCTVLQGRFVDDVTVALTHGDWGAPGDTGSEQVCQQALREYTNALEVSARSALLQGTELRDSSARLEQQGDGIARITERRYAEPDAAERAEREALRGHEELGSLAGVVASSLGERDGEVITTRSFASFDDLRLTFADQHRASLQRQRERTTPSLASVDVHDAEAVRAAFDAELPALTQRSHDAELLGRFAALLTRARELHPEDEGLARRDYQLALTLRGEPRAALVIADEVLARGLGARVDWQTRRRAALAHVDEVGLRAALQTTFALARKVAITMARELNSKVTRGVDYERAEWAFLTARRLALAAQKEGRVRTSLAVPVHELARLFVLLGQSARPEQDLRVHMLVVDAAPLPQGPSEAGPWVLDTLGGGRAGVLLGAPAADDGQQRTLGRVLAARLPEGPFELLLCLEPTDEARAITLVLVGQRRGDMLALASVSRRVAALHRDVLDRLLLSPLRALVGATYPPDELTVQALDTTEASTLVRAAERAPFIKCKVDGLTVRCHGALSDQGAARRALLSLLHEHAAHEAHTLWSGTD